MKSSADSLSRSKSLQLSVRGQPTAFDISPGNELMCVASPGCLTFFHLNGLGTPRHVIHYEQPKQIRAIRYQRTGNIAALRAGIVSLWDSTNSLRPLIGMMQSSGHTIVDLQWSNFNQNLLGTSFQSSPNSGFGCGLVSWDVRSPSSPSYSIPIPGRSCQGVDFGPHGGNSHLISGCIDSKKVMLFDTRVISSNAEKVEAFSVIEPRSGVHHYCWSKWYDDTLLVVSTLSGSVEWWSGLPSSKASARRLGAIRSSNGDAPCTLLPTPMGKAVITSYPKYVDLPQTDTLSKQVVRKLAHQIIGLQGYPADRLPLESLFQPMPIATSSSSVSPKPYAGNNDEFGEGPASSIATCSQRLLGLKWGTPGRLVPPFHGGLELLMLTETAVLHAVKIPLDTVKKCCWAVETGLATNNPVTSVAGKESISFPTGSGNAIAQTILAVGALKPGPKYLPAGGLDRLVVNKYNVSATTGSTNEDAGNVIDGFWSQMQAAIIALDEAISLGVLRGITLGRIDQYARQITLEMTGLKYSASSRHDEDPAVSVIISFPPDFPSAAAPTFSVEGFHSQVGDVDDATKITEALENELMQMSKTMLVAKAKTTNLLYNHAGNPQDFAASFLLDVAHCFKNRVLQCLGGRGAPDTQDGQSISKELTLSSEEFFSSPLIAHANVDAARTTFDSRIPFPRSSGAIFSPMGYLVCFGGCTLNTMLCPKIMKIDVESIPQSYATYLNRKTNNTISADGIAASCADFNFLREPHSSQDSSLRSQTESADESNGGDDEDGAGSEGCYMESSEEESSSGGLTPKDYEVFARGGAYSAGREKTRPPLSGPSAPVHAAIATPTVIATSSPSPPPNASSSAAVPTTPKDSNIIGKAAPSKPACPFVVNQSRSSSDEDLCDSLEGVSSIGGRNAKASMISFYYVVDLLPQWLAANYSTGSPSSRGVHNWSTSVESCRCNARVVDDLIVKIQASSAFNLISGSEIYRLQSVAQIWRLLAVSFEIFSISERETACTFSSEAKSKGEASMDLMSSWVNSALGRPLCTRLIGCLLSNSTPVAQIKPQPSRSVSGNSLQTTAEMRSFDFVTADLQTLATVICIVGSSDQLLKMVASELQAKLSKTLLDRILEHYSSNLLLWRLPIQSLEVSKHRHHEIRDEFATMGSICKEIGALDVQWYCSRCGKLSENIPRSEVRHLDRTRNCLNCAQRPSRCCLCQLPVRTAGIYCFKCGHGGHSQHMSEWFSDHMECSTGCGCQCTDDTTTNFTSKIVPETTCNSSYLSDEQSDVEESDGESQLSASDDSIEAATNRKEEHLSKMSQNATNVPEVGARASRGAEQLNAQPQTAPPVPILQLPTENVVDMYNTDYASPESDSEFDISSSESFRMYL